MRIDRRADLSLTYLLLLWWVPCVTYRLTTRAPVDAPWAGVGRALLQDGRVHDAHPPLHMKYLYSDNRFCPPPAER